MKKLQFSRYLIEHVLKDFTRSELLRNLQLYREEFSGLDSVTLSRWVNQKTLPPLDKQILIAVSTNTQSQFLDSFKEHERISCPQNLIRPFSEFMFRMDDLYHGIKFDSSKKLYINMKRLTWDEYIIEMKKFKSLYNVFDDILNPILKEKRPCILMFYLMNSNNEVLSFTGIETNIEHMSHVLDIDRSIINCTSMTLFSYYQSSKHCKLLIGVMFNYLFFYFNKNHILQGRGKEAAHLSEAIKSDMISVFKSNLNVGNLYFYRFETHKLISSPVIFNLILQTRRVYKNLFVSDVCEINIDQIDD